MDASVDYYDVLGVPPTASRTEIKTAWSTLVQKLHPDMGGDAQLFMQVQKAFTVLGDEKQRAQYDELRELTSTSTNPEDVSTPGWGEAATGTGGGQPSAAQPRPAKKARKKPYVPPHLRDQQPEETVISEPEPARPERHEEVRKPSTPHRAWRLGLKEDPDVSYTPSPRWLWGVPLVLTVLVVALWPVTASVGDSTTLAKVMPFLTGFAMLVSIIGVCITWAKTKAGMKSSAGIVAPATIGVIVSVVALFASGPLLVVTIAAMVLMIAAGVLFTKAFTYVYVQTRSLPLKTLRSYNTFGTPASTADTTAQALVEIHTKDRLENLADIASLRVFHTVGVPVTPQEVQDNAFVRTKYGVPVLPGYRVEHVLTAGNRMALIFSTIWPAGEYTVDQYGYIRINDEPTGQSLGDLAESLNHWKAVLDKGVEARAFLAIYPDGPATSEIKSDITAVLADDLEDTVGEWLVSGQEQVDRTLCSKVAEHLLT